MPWLRLLSAGPLVILVLLVSIVAIVTPSFVKPINLGNILAQTSVIAIVAMGQQLVILTRGIDLSVGSNLALSTVIGGLVFQATGSTVPVVAAMVATGALVGAVNGLVYVHGRLPHPFIITLATLSICRGLALALAPGHTTMRGMPDAVAALGSQTLLGLPLGVFVVALVAGFLLILTRSMVIGRWIASVGGNPQAAVSMGIPVKGVLVATYVISVYVPASERWCWPAAPMPHRRSTANCWNWTQLPPSSSAAPVFWAGVDTWATR